MFFRREAPHIPSFEERLQSLKKLGFSTAPDTAGGVRVSRKGFGATIKDLSHGKVGIGHTGLLVGNEIAHMVNGGYQMFFGTPSGKQIAATAPQLTVLHNFDEDLREGLGLTSLYNTSLGTTSEAHMYDRVKDRDQPHGPRPWEKKVQA
jgi:hypothetical protein